MHDILLDEEHLGSIVDIAVCDIVTKTLYPLSTTQGPRSGPLRRVSLAHGFF